MNECYTCDYRGDVPGSAHSSCDHPEKQQVKVEGEAHGKNMGWFFWPYNFDPVWLISCTGYKENNKEESK